MPKLKNVGPVLLTFGPGDLARTGPEPWLPTGQSWSIKPNEEKTIFEDDYAKSRGIKAAVASGALQIVDETEPVPDGRLEGLSGGTQALVTLKVTKTYADFAAAAIESPQVTILPIPAGAVVLSVKMKTIITFAGAGVDQVDLSGDVDSVQQGAINWTIMTTASTVSINAGINSYGEVASELRSTMQTYLVGVPVNTNLLTAGEVTYWVTYFVQD
jgi:hypothetical protein